MFPTGSTEICLVGIAPLYLYRFPARGFTHRPDHGGSQTSETLFNSHQSARRNNPEDSRLHSHRRENLKSYKM
jgi:hypothetical protein